MSREYKRLQDLDKQYNLQIADMAENLEDKFNRRQIENHRLLYEIDGIPRQHQKYKNIPIKGSGDLYLKFGNNTVQDEINKSQLCLVQKCNNQ